MDQLLIILPPPPAAANPNVRPHWAGKAKAKKKQRYDACMAARNAMLSQHGIHLPFQWKSATCQATFYVYRKGDGDNRLASLKASFDGLQDAGVIANDSGLTHLPVIQIIVKRGEEKKVVLEIKEEGAACS